MIQIDIHIGDISDNDIIDMVIANAIPRLDTQYSDAAVKQGMVV